MTITLRISLIVASVLLLLYTVRKIRKSQLDIDDTVFWIVFPAFLLLISIFPGIAVSASRLLGIESPANFIFLAVIALLLVKLFGLTVELSVQKRRLTHLVQAHALAEQERRRAKEDEHPSTEQESSPESLSQKD